MSAVWCVKCNVSTMILRTAHDHRPWCIREHGNTARKWPKVGFDPLRASAVRHQARRDERRSCIRGPRTARLPCEQYDSDKIAFDARGSEP
jgi:hypothetical protein